MSHRSKKSIPNYQEPKTVSIIKSIKNKPIKKAKKSNETKANNTKKSSCTKKKTVLNKANHNTKPVIYDRFDFKNYKQTVLKMLKVAHHNSMKTDLDFMHNENFFNLVSFAAKMKENPLAVISFGEECQANLKKRMIIKNNEHSHKKFEAMEIFIKIYNGLKKFVNSWDSDQQIKSLTRKLKLPPNFFSKIYQTIHLSEETLNLPSSADLKLFEERVLGIVDEEEEEEENDNNLNNKEILLYLDKSDEKGILSFEDLENQKQLKNSNNKNKKEFKREKALMDIVDFIFLLAKTDPSLSLQNSLSLLNNNSGKTQDKCEMSNENEENNSLSSTDKSLYFCENDNKRQEKMLENIMNEENINYSKLINKILMPISKKIIGLITDFTLACSRLKEILKRREKDPAQQGKTFSTNNIIITPPMKE